MIIICLYSFCLYQCIGIFASIILYIKVCSHCGPSLSPLPTPFLRSSVHCPSLPLFSLSYCPHLFHPRSIRSSHPLFPILRITKLNVDPYPHCFVSHSNPVLVIIVSCKTFIVHCWHDTHADQDWALLQLSTLSVWLFPTFLNVTSAHNNTHLN